MMSKLKIWLSFFMILAVVLGRVGSVQAAPPQQDEVPITGSVQGVVIEADLETVLVTLLVSGEAQTVRISAETAIGLGLFVLDGMGNPVLGEDGKPLVDGAVFGTDIEISPSAILPDEAAMDEKQHPIGVKISEFFSGLLGADYDLVMGSHADGFGFGVITQALWITDTLGGDASFFQTILDAKKSGDYSLVTLPSGGIPQNWGQFKKAVLKSEDGNSLGDVDPGNDQSGNPGNGNGKPDDPGNGNGKPNDPGNGNGKPADPGNGNGKPDNPGDGNKPDTPPGQTKDKDKDNNGNNKIK